MKPFFISLGIFVLLTAGIILHSYYLDGVTCNMEAALSDIKLKADTGETDDALQSAAELERLVERSYRYLDIMVNHEELDKIKWSAQKISVYIMLEKHDELRVEIDGLLEQISHIREIESISLLNIL